MEKYVFLESPASSEFLEELLNILGDPSNVEFYVRNSEIQEGLSKFLREQGIEGSLNECVINGKCDGKTLLGIYANQFKVYESLEKLEKDFKTLGVKQMRWHKHEVQAGRLHTNYSFSFDCYVLKGGINLEKERDVLDSIIDLLSKYQVKYQLDNIQ